MPMASALHRYSHLALVAAIRTILPLSCPKPSEILRLRLVFGWPRMHRFMWTVGV
jgi:hypothetical protein